jgi:3-methyl-2-oxobutanoate hydroxymethyltransferase
LAKKSIADLIETKRNNGKIVLVVTYDYQTAMLADEAGVDIILVGDSGGRIMLGYTDLISVTFEDMMHFCKGVSRGTSRSLVIADMPFMTYSVSNEQALTNAARYMQEGHVDGVMVEGGYEIKEKIQSLVEAGIPVLGHIGKLFQKPSQIMGDSNNIGNRARRLVGDAKALEEAGVFALVLEAVPPDVSELITETLKIPVLGAAGSGMCDGQALVLHDLIGLRRDDGSRPFVKRYAEVHETITSAITEFAQEVRGEKFPDEGHMLKHLSKEDLEQIRELRLSDSGKTESR